MGDGSRRDRFVRLLGFIAATIAVVVFGLPVLLRAVLGSGVGLRSHHWFVLVVSVVLFIVQGVLFVRRSSW